jgi:hypothetical protein
VAEGLTCGSSLSGISIPVRSEIYGTMVPFVKYPRYDLP